MNEWREIEREKIKRFSASTSVPHHGCRWRYPSTPWSSERVVHPPLQAEACHPDSVVAATAASVVDSQCSPFPSQESEFVTTPVRSYPSQVQQVVTDRGAESSNHYPTRPHRLTRSPTEVSCSDSLYPRYGWRFDWAWCI